LEFTGTGNPVVEGHGAGEYTHGGAGPEENVPSGSQTPNRACASRVCERICQQPCKDV
jgi:hypothetical protein